MNVQKPKILIGQRTVIVRLQPSSTCQSKLSKSRPLIGQPQMAAIPRLSLDRKLRAVNQKFISEKEQQTIVILSLPLSISQHISIYLSINIIHKYHTWKKVNILATYIHTYIYIYLYIYLSIIIFIYIYRTIDRQIDVQISLSLSIFHSLSLSVTLSALCRMISCQIYDQVIKGSLERGFPNLHTPHKNTLSKIDRQIGLNGYLSILLSIHLSIYLSFYSPFSF